MEKIVHKEVIKEVTVGVSEEELSKVRGRVGTASTPSSTRWRCALATQVHAEAERKKEEIRERAERELAAERSARPRRRRSAERLRADLVKQETERKAASQRKRALAAKLKGMENKLLKGGALAASRRVETTSCPSYEVVAGFCSDFELVRAESGPSGRVRARGRGDGVFATHDAATPSMAPE